MTSMGIIPVPFLPLSASLARESESALDGHRFRLVHLSSWDELVALPSKCSVRAIAADSLAQAGVSAGLSRVFLERPEARVLFICGPRGEATRPDSDLSPNLTLATLPRDAGGLPVLLGRTWADGRAAGLCERIREALHVPLVLRLFLRKVLENRLASTPSAMAWNLLRNVEALCQASGISRSQVYIQAGRAGIRPKAIVDAWSAVQVLVTRDIEDVSWIEMELRSGFRSSSGLAGLVQRGVGHTPANLPTADAQYWFCWFEEEVLAPILELGAGREVG